MLISTAYAQSLGFGGQDGAFVQFMPLVLIFVVFYFLLIRPQQKRQKQHAEVLKNLRRNDKVIVAGIYGTVSKVMSDSEVEVEIAANTKIKVVRAAISEVLTKSEPVPSNADKGNSDKGNSDKKDADSAVQDNTQSDGK